MWGCPESAGLPPRGRGLADRRLNRAGSPKEVWRRSSGGEARTVRVRGSCRDSKDARKKPEAGGPPGAEWREGAQAPSSSSCGTRAEETQGRSWDKGESREELGGVAWKGRRMPGGCSSPFMNSQAPISSPDSAAILSEIRTGEGWVVAN